MLRKTFTRAGLALMSISVLLTGCQQTASKNNQAVEPRVMTLNEQAKEVEFFVATNGSDDNPGTKAQPLKSLQGARDAIRRLKKIDRQQNITVWLRGGVHRLTDTFVLNRQDSGSKGKVIRYRAYQNEKPQLSSGKLVKGWKRLATDVEGLPAFARNKVWVADVSREDYGRFTALFTDNKRLQRAKSARFDGEKPTGYEIADSRNVMHKKDRHLLRKIVYKQGAPIRDWSNLDDIEVFFNPVPWALNFIPLEAIDLDKRLLTLKYEANAPAFSQNRPWAVIENAIDFLDEAGEWVHNSETGKLYYWPYDNNSPGNIYVPQLSELVRVEGDIDYHGSTDLPVKNLSFEGITFTQSKRSTWHKNHKGWGIQHDWDSFDTGNAMLRFRGAEDVLVEGNHFTNTAGSAIRLDLHAQNITIKNNLINYVGHMGILLAGYGPGTKDVNHHNTITNNIIHHVGEIIWHGHGIFAWQSGNNLIANNWIHDVPRKAIGICGVRVQILMKTGEDFDEAAKTIRWDEIDTSVTWQEDTQAHFMPYLHAKNNVIENNKVTKTLLRLHDGSSINVSGAGEGNIVRHNFIYDVDYIAVRTDDWQRGTTTENNIIVRAGTGIVHKDFNHIVNNIFYDLNGESIRMRAFPRQFFKPGSIIQRNIFTDARRPPYGSRDLWNTPEFFATKKGIKLIPYEYELDNNLFVFEKRDPEVFLAPHQKHGVELNSKISTSSIFLDPENFDFRFKNKQLADEIGFKAFDVNMRSFGITEEYPADLLKQDSRLTQWGKPTRLHGGIESKAKDVH